MAALLAIQCASNALNADDETEQNTVRYRSRPYKGCATSMPCSCTTASSDYGTAYYNEEFDC